MLGYEIAAAAQKEIDEAVAWYDAAGPSLGDRLAVEIQKAVQRVRELPETYPKVSKRSRRCRVHQFPYAIVYQVRDERVYVIAVTHLRRKPAYWKERE